MQPESYHHARDPFAQGLGPYTEIPVKKKVTRFNLHLPFDKLPGVGAKVQKIQTGNS